MKIDIKLLDPKAKIPVKAKAGDAAYDLFALEGCQILPGQRKLIKTGIAMAIPAGYYGRVAERSGLALKQNFEIGGGVIDETYSGDVGVIAINGSQGPIEDTIIVNAGDRVAQLIIEKYYEAEFNVVEELAETVRGENGFGSTKGYVGGLHA